MLTVLFPVKETNKYKASNWLCQCECGNTVVRSGASLRNNTTCSCGCGRYNNARATAMKKHFVNIGKKFGKLTVLEVVDAPEDIQDNRFYYRCVCDCGNFTTVRATDIKSGKTLSCGCAKQDAEARDREDLTGRKFNRLTVLGFAGVKKNRTGYWTCRCDCGTEIEVRCSDLLNGHTSSCGCIISLGEENIAKILNTAGVKYLHNNGYFKDLVSEYGLPLRYDFIIFDENDNVVRLIEFDGPQHKKPNDLFGVDEFEKLQYHDMLKNQYALSHNIPLVRIPYTKRNNIFFEDLFDDKYLINGGI